MTKLSPVHSPGQKVSIALLHHPVYDKNRRVVATAITNLDLHDMARMARTFDLNRYFVVTPVEEQRLLAERIRGHWQDGWGGSYNPDRREAMELLQVMPDLDSVLAELENNNQGTPRIIATGAAQRVGSISCAALRTAISEEDGPFLLLFGTGWGLSDEVFEKAHMVLEPIMGAGEYNHLSVRAAAAIILDRLFGGR